MAKDRAKIAVRYDPSGNGCLRPHTLAASDTLAELTPGTVYMIARPNQPRKGKLHRLYWALCQLVANAANAGPLAIARIIAEDVSDRIKIAAGRTQFVKLKPAQAKRYETPVAVMPASISFAAMSDDEFSRLVTAGMIYIDAEIAPNLLDGPDRDKVLEILKQSHVSRGVIGHNGGPEINEKDAA